MSMKNCFVISLRLVPLVATDKPSGDPLGQISLVLFWVRYALIWTCSFALTSSTLQNDIFALHVSALFQGARHVIAHQYFPKI